MREKTNVEDLVNMTMKNKPIYVDQVEKEEKIADCLEEGYVLAPSDKRFHFLLSFLEKNKKKKVIVLLSSCLSTKHHHDLLTSLDVPVFSIHVIFLFNFKNCVHLFFHFVSIKNKSI